ncbi:MAG: family 43 glycosylhydrolase, partial [Paludibacter sp.]|nr:family 43 glycosylhydrolase [Paludibacter sp.]
MIITHRSFTSILISAFLLITLLTPAQFPEKRLCNPLLPMRDGAVERFMGKYYATGEAVKGNVYYTKDLIHWSEPVKAISADKATWLKDPKWSQSYTYKEFQAADLIYRNGVFHTYWNGVGHAYSPTPLGPYKESSINAPFDDYGIDVQVFQDEDGEIYWVKKRNGGDPHPLNGEKSDIDGPEVWTFRMVSPFSRWDITEGNVQLTNQRGHPTSVNHHNFEGPELAKYRGRYYLFYASNRMGPRSGMYQIGVAESDQPMNFDNTKKYPHPVLTRNTEQHLLDYKVILHSAEHGGWEAKYTTSLPSGNWKALTYNDETWIKGNGGFGRQEYDLFGNRQFTNAKIRARKTIWDSEKIYIRRKFRIEQIPQKIALKHWVFANANFFINGKRININASNNTYSFLQLDPGLFVKGENIIVVEATSPCNNQFCQQFVDFGLYDTGLSDTEDIVVGPAQPNFVVGPNGFERWMMYKAYFDNRQEQGIDRIHFYDKEVVVENSTVKNTQGFRRKPSLPQYLYDFEKPDYNAFEFLNDSKWKVAGGVLSPESNAGGALLFCNQAETHYRFEVPFRLKSADSRAGVYAYYQDKENWLKILIGKDYSWEVQMCIRGNISSNKHKLPPNFDFLDKNSLVKHYVEPWHTLTIYKNGNRFKVELDHFNITLQGDLITLFSDRGNVGLIAVTNQVDFDAVQYTNGWDEYDENITGWKSDEGNWSVSAKGFYQTDSSVESIAIKGDPSKNYEF